MAQIHSEEDTCYQEENDHGISFHDKVTYENHPECRRQKNQPGQGHVTFGRGGYFLYIPLDRCIGDIKIDCPKNQAPDQQSYKSGFGQVEKLVGEDHDRSEERRVGREWRWRGWREE